MDWTTFAHPLATAFFIVSLLTAVGFVVWVFLQLKNREDI